MRLVLYLIFLKCFYFPFSLKNTTTTKKIKNTSTTKKYEMSKFID